MQKSYSFIDPIGDDEITVRTLVPLPVVVLTRRQLWLRCLAFAAGGATIATIAAIVGALL